MILRSKQFVLVSALTLSVLSFSLLYDFSNKSSSGGRGDEVRALQSQLDAVESSLLLLSECDALDMLTESTSDLNYRILNFSMVGLGNYEDISSEIKNLSGIIGESTHTHDNYHTNPESAKITYSFEKDGRQLGFVNSSNVYTSIYSDYINNKSSNLDLLANALLQYIVSGAYEDKLFEGVKNKVYNNEYTLDSISTEHIILSTYDESSNPIPPSKQIELAVENDVFSKKNEDSYLFVADYQLDTNPGYQYYCKLTIDASSISKGV